MIADMLCAEQPASFDALPGLAPLTVALTGRDWEIVIGRLVLAGTDGSADEAAPLGERLVMELVP